MIKRISIAFSFLVISMQTAYSQELWNPVFHSENTHWADSVLVNLSEDERIAQLFMVAAYSNKENSHKEEISTLIKDYKIGGLMFLQGNPTKQAKLTNHFQSISTKFSMSN